jgi:secreted PhoX family phosphatase
MVVTRRELLARSAAGLGLAVVGKATGVLDAATAGASGAHHRGGYGALSPLAPTNGGPPVLALPEGFSYVTFGATGAPLMTGGVHARNHDGMAALPTRRRRVARLTRNQEVRTAPGTPAGIDAVGGPAGTKYDAKGVGGVTVIDFDTSTGTVLNEFVGINGTIVNCAGGIARHNSGWITCEETTAGPPQGWDQKHGYAFFLPGQATTTVAAVPLTAMGRFAHEACAVDRQGIVYQTEDAGSGRPSGFYRYVPDDPRDLSAGGALEMLAVDGQPGVDLREGRSIGEKLAVTWVPIDAPDPDPVVDFGAAGANSCFTQGHAAGGAGFNRLEGIWADGNRIVFCSTSGGEVKNGDVNADGFAEGYGQIWEYRAHTDTLELIYEPTSGSALDSPDNLLVTPRGGIVLCEDDASDIDADVHPLATGIENVNRLVGLVPGGEPFELAVNVLNDSEFAGACFSPDGTTLFANVFGGSEPGSGMTCAITGPWRRGGL